MSGIRIPCQQCGEPKLADVEVNTCWCRLDICVVCQTIHRRSCEWHQNGQIKPEDR